MTTGIVHYDQGNIGSVQKAVERAGGKTIIVRTPEMLNEVDKIILPGVGHFDTAMKTLEERGLVSALHAQVIEAQKPILGICLGMQLMTRSSEEGTLPGLGWIDAQVLRFNSKNSFLHKIPHSGWNSVEFASNSPLQQGITSDNEYYFIHSYYVKCNVEEEILGITDYIQPFHSAFRKGHIYGVQFHPEKSLDFGKQMLKNFIDLC